ncbi:hypothetical protein D3C71_1754550 [compost metagenome]
MGLGHQLAEGQQPAFEMVQVVFRLALLCRQLIETFDFFAQWAEALLDKVGNPLGYRQI